MTTLRRIDVKAKRKDNRIMTVKKLRLDFAEQFCIRIEEKQCLRHIVKNKMTVPESANRSCIGGQKRDQFNTAMQQLLYFDEQEQFQF